MNAENVKELAATPDKLELPKFLKREQVQDAPATQASEEAPAEQK